MYFPVPDTPVNLIAKGLKPIDVGIINQHGLNRKVLLSIYTLTIGQAVDRLTLIIVAYLRFCKGQLEASSVGLHRRASVYVSSKRIGTAVRAHIHLGHRFDYDTPIEETVRSSKRS